MRNLHAEASSAPADFVFVPSFVELTVKAVTAWAGLAVSARVAAISAAISRRASARVLPRTHVIAGIRIMPFGPSFGCFSACQPSATCSDAPVLGVLRKAWREA